MKTKSFIALFGLCLVSSAGIAQGVPVDNAFWSDPFNHPMLPAYATMAFILVSVLVAAGAVVVIGRAIKAITPAGEKKKEFETSSLPVRSASSVAFEVQIG